MTYQEIVDTLGIGWCQGCSVAINHDTGYSNMSTGTIHWRNRAVTRPGLYNFLKLYAAILKSHNRGQDEWRILWEQATEAYRIARGTFKTLIPRRYSKTERIRVWSLLQKVPTTSLDIYNAKQWAKEALR